MAFRLHRKPVPIALSLRAAAVPNKHLPCLGIRFTPTPFTVVYLAERKAALGLEPAKCLEDKTFWNQYLYWQNDIHVRYYDSQVFPGYDQGTDVTKRCVLAVSNYSKPTPTTPHTIAAGFLELSKASKVSTLQTDRTLWKVDDFSILIDETYFGTTDKTYLLTNENASLAPRGRLVHRIGHIEVSGTLSKQEIAELEMHPQGEVAKSIVERLETFLNDRSIMCSKYQEGGEKKITDAHSDWIKHMRGVSTNVTRPNQSVVKFEISRHFRPTESSLASLRTNSGTPQFEGLEYIGSQIFKENMVEVRWQQMLRSEPAHGLKHTDDWTKEYSIYDMEMINKNENGDRINFGRNFEYMRGYRTNFDPSYEKTRTKRKLAKYFSDDSTLKLALACYEHIHLDLTLRTLREEWSVGDYVIAFDQTEVSWSDPDHRADSPDRPLVTCGYTTGFVGLCKTVENGELEAFKKREGHTMKYFMEKHCWAFGEVPDEAPKDNFFKTETESTHAQEDNLKKEVTDQPIHSVSPLSSLAGGRCKNGPSPKVCLSKRTIKFKVERQFLPTNYSISVLRENSGRAPIRGLRYVGSETLHESYGEVGYDGDDWDEENHHYSAQDHSARIAEDFYVVSGIGVMHVKVPRSGNTVNGGYEEIHGEDKILKYLSTTVGCPVHLFNIKEVVAMQTRREKWRAGDYTMIIDTTKTDGDPIPEEGYPCMHKTGSVTWCEEIEEGQEEMVWKRENERMDRFMKKHYWAFGNPINESQTKVAKCIEDQENERDDGRDHRLQS